MDIINKTKELIPFNGIWIKEETKEFLDKTACSFNSSTELHILLYFILLLIFLLVILKYKDFFIKILRLQQSKNGYVHIMYRLPNKRIKDLFIKLDNFNNFHHKQCLHSLDKMHDYIFGYDKNNLPVFLYDKHFILPLKLDSKTINEELSSDYELETGEKLDNKKLQVLKLKIDSSVLETVYDRKIIDDLYSKPIDKTTLFIIIGVIAAIIIILLIVTGQYKEILKLFQSG